MPSRDAFALLVSGGCGPGGAWSPRAAESRESPEKGVEGSSFSPPRLHPGARWHLQAPTAQDAASFAPQTHACRSAGAEVMEAPTLWGWKLPGFGQRGRGPARRAGTTLARPPAGESVDRTGRRRCPAARPAVGELDPARLTQRLQALSRAHLLAGQPAFLPISGRPDCPSCFLGVADDLMLARKARGLRESRTSSYHRFGSKELGFPEPAWPAVYFIPHAAPLPPEQRPRHPEKVSLPPPPFLNQPLLCIYVEATLLAKGPQRRGQLGQSPQWKQ